MQNLSFSVWLISYGIIPSWSTHVVSNGKMSYIFYGWVVFHCVCVNVCVYQWTRMYPWAFHILTIKNNATMNIGYIYHSKLVFLFYSDKIPSSNTTQGNMVVLFTKFPLFFSIYSFCWNFFFVIMHQFVFSLAVFQCLFFSTSCQYWLYSCLLDNS